MAKPILAAEHFWSEAAAIAFLEARLWPNGKPACPHCGVIDRAKKLNGKTTRPGLWKCYACMKPFTVKVGTVFEASHIPLHIWLQTVHLMGSSKKGISTHQIARTMGVTVKTAWFMTMRVREAMKAIGMEPLGGPWRTVESDETYVGRKSTTQAFKPPAVKAPVVSLVERGGAVRSFHVPNVTIENLAPIVARHVHTDSRFMTDSNYLSLSLGLRFGERHHTVNHSKDEYARGSVYTNTVEGYFSILKRGIYGIHQHVSEAHLHRYLAEFDFRYSHRAKLGVDDAQRADLILEGAVGKRLTYRTTRGKRPAAPAAEVAP